MKKRPEHLLVNKIECLHLQHLLREEELAGRDASLALELTTGNTQEANLTGYLSRKTGGSFITQLSLALL
jgi:hypothetical protein